MTSPRTQPGAPVAAGQNLADGAGLLLDRLPTSIGRHPGDGPSAVLEDGLGAGLNQATGLLREALRRLDPDRITGPQAVELYESLVTIERLSAGAKTLLAPRIDRSGIWRDRGHRNSAVMLAELEGVSTGQARRTIQVGQRLQHLPATEEAVRQGKLSGPKVDQLSGAATIDPAAERDLLAGADEQPLHLVKERCQRARATAARHDPLASIRRIRATRHFSSWTDADGAFCYQGRDTAERGAQILRHIEQAAQGLRSGSIPSPTSSTGEHDPPESDGETGGAQRADAFFVLLTQSDHTPLKSPVETPAQPSALPAPGVIDRPPTCTVMVRVDLAALLRGDVRPGELCEIDGQGPIPVPMARNMANDSFLAYVFHQAGDIRAISHHGRTINRRLRTALAHRDRGCVVPGCGVTWGLEIDHVVPFAEGGPTTLDNLALLCHHHHFLKTFEGWTLEQAPESSTGWSFEPQPPFGQEADLGLDRPGGWDST